MTVGTKCFLWMGEKKVGEFVCNSQSNQNVFRYSDNWVKEGFPLSRFADSVRSSEVRSGIQLSSKDTVSSFE